MITAARLVRYASISTECDPQFGNLIPIQIIFATNEWLVRASGRLPLQYPYNLCVVFFFQIGINSKH
jgi:hypothetical protein